MKHITLILLFPLTFAFKGNAYSHNDNVLGTTIKLVTIVSGPPIKISDVWSFNDLDDCDTGKLDAAEKDSLFQPPSELFMQNDLPLKLVPAPVKNDLPLVFFISGDGGWKNWDQKVSEELAKAGMPVVGLNAQKYFWNEKQPQKVSGEFGVVIKQYMQIWRKSRFILIGYSFGACVAPFIAINFDEELKAQLKGVYCFSPDLTGDFEIHLTDMLHLNTKRKYNVISGLMKIKFLNPVCLFGDEEDVKIRNEFSKSGATIRILPGDHHYSDDFKVIAGVVLNDF